MKMATGRLALGLATCCAALLASAPQVGAVVFTGASGTDLLFSTTNNWDTFPTVGVVVGNFANTSAGNPAQLDALYSDALSNTGNFTIATPGNGTAYVQVLGGAKLKTTNLYVGNNNQALRGGVLTLDQGSTLEPTAFNTGTLFVGFNGAGRVVAKAGLAGFGFSNLNLGSNGTLAYAFGANSVSAFTVTKSNGAATLLLDGVVEVDLAAQPAVGTYTLIQCNDASTVATGALADWLAGQGGSFSGLGTYDGGNFKVLNAGATEWMLSSADGGGTLNFTVIPEPATLGLLMASTGALMVFRRLRL